MLLWTPKYDHLLPPEERGVSASFERFPDEDEEKDLVTEARDSPSERIVQIATSRRTYELDLRKVERDELATMRKTFGKMSRLGGLRYVRVRLIEALPSSRPLLPRLGERLGGYAEPFVQTPHHRERQGSLAGQNVMDAVSTADEWNQMTRGERPF